MKALRWLAVEALDLALDGVARLWPLALLILLLLALIGRHHR